MSKPKPALVLSCAGKEVMLGHRTQDDGGNSVIEPITRMPHDIACLVAAGIPNKVWSSFARDPLEAHQKPYELTVLSRGTGKNGPKWGLAAVPQDYTGDDFRYKDGVHYVSHLSDAHYQILTSLGVLRAGSD